MKSVVCPAQLRKGLFTSGALDNLDHNLTRTTATDSFHGTGISIFQSPTKSEKANMDEGDIIAWSAYHASLQHPSDDIQPALTQLLPLFNEKAATSSMIKHGMDILKKATQFLNPRWKFLVLFSCDPTDSKTTLSMWSL